VCPPVGSVKRVRLGKEEPVFGAPRLLVVAYVAIGLVVAAARDYLDDVDTARELLSAVIAVAIWPLVLLGFDVTIR
jgi:hypothetical protein